MRLNERTSWRKIWNDRVGHEKALCLIKSRKLEVVILVDDFKGLRVAFEWIVLRVDGEVEESEDASRKCRPE